MAMFIFAKAILEGTPIKLFNHGNMRRDFTYVDDIVAGVVAAADRPLGYEGINLGRGQPTLLADFVRLIEGMLRVAGYTLVHSTTDPNEVCELHRKIRSKRRTPT